MRQIIVTSFGGPEVLHLTDRAEPTLGAGAVLVRVAACGIGLVDVMMRQGAFPALPLPFTPGVEIAGVVEQVGAGVPAELVGSRVYAAMDIGGYASHVVIAATNLVVLPDAVDFGQAVALGVNALVAMAALQRANLREGERVLVRGGSGGIGLMAIQLAKAFGAVVTATSGSGYDLHKFGADKVVGRSISGPDQFDVIIDPVAGAELPNAMERLAMNGRLIVCGAAGGFPPADFAAPLLGAFAKSLMVSALSLNSIAANEKAAMARRIFALAEIGRLQPVIHAKYALGGVGAAHTALEAGAVFGKLIAVP